MHKIENLHAIITAAVIKAESNEQYKNMAFYQQKLNSLNSKAFVPYIHFYFLLFIMIVNLIKALHFSFLTELRPNNMLTNI